MARTKTTKKKSNCKTALYKFCKKQTEKKYKNTKLNRKKNRVGRNIYRYTLKRVN